MHLHKINVQDVSLRERFQNACKNKGKCLTFLLKGEYVRYIMTRILR